MKAILVTVICAMLLCGGLAWGSPGGSWGRDGWLLVWEDYDSGDRWRLSRGFEERRRHRERQEMLDRIRRLEDQQRWDRFERRFLR